MADRPPINLMKARDIIDGWPRGGSTSRPWVRWWYMSPEMQIDLELDRLYHEAQAKMLYRLCVQVRQVLAEPCQLPSGTDTLR